MAKGIEDTSMYRDVRLLALNEVGGDPDRFGITVDEFHRVAASRGTAWPRALLAATTHDTKRNADTRARIAMLSTMGDAWLALVGRWSELCADHADGGAGPDHDEQLFVLQTLVGTWPISSERLDGYLVKAWREAKRHTNWIEPDEAWERGAIDVVHRAFAEPAFVEVFAPFLDDVVDRAERMALGTLVLRCTTPGVPDVYQGDELWNLALVDPDNRRPVDWDLRRAVLAHVVAGAPVERATAKLFATRTLLELRRRFDAFADLPYVAIDAGLDVCAFTRGDRVLVAVPVRPDADLPPLDRLVGDGTWDDVLAALDPVCGVRRPAVYVRR
jgi:(1->4)-alpha-D-glucan 1-alpha-D-glucosylmutase